MQPERIHRVLGGRDRDPSAALLRGLTALAEPAYTAAVTLRNRRYDRQKHAEVTLGKPVISIGNLTTGGTGKTPLVIDLARWLRQEGIHPAVLLRGYKSNEHGSDEQAELQHALGKHVPVVANADRAVAAEQAFERRPDLDVFLLDDGFQHRKVHRDLDLVLLDAREPFGYGRVLPRGLLREPLHHLSRADAVLVTRCDRASLDELEGLDRTVARLTGRPPLAHIEHAWAGVTDQTGLHLGLDALAGETVVAAAGVGQPAAFFEMVDEHAGRLAKTFAYPDHHDFIEDDLRQVFREARSLKAGAVVVTEKDWVKWAAVLGTFEPPITVLRPRLTLRWRHGIEPVQRLVRDALR